MSDKSTPPPSSGKRAKSGMPVRLRKAQVLALEHLMAGTPIHEAARHAGVDRRTLYRWIKSDPKFAATYNAWRKETVDSGQARVLAMGDAALDVLEKAIKNGNAQIALQVVRSTGMMDRPAPGLTDPRALAIRQELRESRQEMSLSNAEDEASRLRGENSLEWMKDILKLEDRIDWYLKERSDAIARETPEELAARNARTDYITGRKLKRLLELMDEEDKQVRMRYLEEEKAREARRASAQGPAAGSAHQASDPPKGAPTSPPSPCSSNPTDPPTKSIANRVTRPYNPYADDPLDAVPWSDV